MRIWTEKWLRVENSRDLGESKSGLWSEMPRTAIVGGFVGGF